jgi:glycosyltransferase involved in cell wall biosynthesis
LTVIRAVYRLQYRHPEIRLVFLGTQHPNTTIQTMPMQHRAEALAKELKMYGTHVVFQTGWVPYNTLSNYLLDADIGVSAHLNTLETHFSFRTRILHYLWAGKPIITTDGDVLAEAIVNTHAGMVIKPQDEEGWIEAIERMRDGQEYARCVEGVTQLAQRYGWLTVTQPLRDLCANATVAPDIRIENGSRQFLHKERDCEKELQALKSYVEWIEHSNSWRITAPLRAVRRWLTR